MQSKERKLQKWNDFTQKLFSSLELETTAKMIVDSGLDLLEMQRGWISIVDPAAKVDRFLLGRSKEDRTLEEKDFSGSRSFVTEVLKRPDVQSEIHAGRLRLFIPFFSARSTAEKNIIGYLYVERPASIELQAPEKELAEVFAEHAAIALENVQLYEMATRDQLTGAYLRHYFDAVSFVEWKRTLRHVHPLSILLLDIDRFKTINEKYGRPEGDAVLKTTANILREASRTEDLLCRYAAEEFILLLPETDESGVKKVASRIQELVAMLLMTSDHQKVTVSIGAATYPHCAVNTIQDLIRLAEIARVRGFQLGGGRTVLYDPRLSNEHVRVFA